MTSNVRATDTMKSIVSDEKFSELNTKIEKEKKN